MDWKNVKEYYRIGHIVHVRDNCIYITGFHGTSPPLMILKPNAELCGVPSGTSERAPGYAAGGNGE